MSRICAMLTLLTEGGEIMATSPDQARAPMWPAIIFLLWTLIGVAAFVMQSSADLETLAKTDPHQARIWAEMPAWAWAAYGLAVGAGLAGALALILRRGSAVWLSALCLIAVIVQFCYTFFLTDLLAVRGWSTMAFPAFIIVMALAQTLYARSLQAKGVLR
jgi:hypothetical protein